MPRLESGSGMEWIDIGQGVNAFQHEDGEYVVFKKKLPSSKTTLCRIRW
jgi:hypothetical protein